MLSRSISRNKRKRAPLRRSLRKKKRIGASDWLVRGNNPARAMAFRGYGFPDSLTTNLSYSQSFLLTPSAVNIMPTHRFRLNSVYDPDYETGGLQPYWFDQLAAVYGRYKVVGAKITAKFCYTSQATSPVGVGPTIVGIQTSDSTATSTTDGGTIMSTSNTNWGILSTNYDTVTTVATYSPKQAFGDEITDAITADTGGNPTRNWLAHVFITPQGVLATNAVNVFVTIEYRVKFTQQTQNAGS